MELIYSFIIEHMHWYSLYMYEFAVVQWCCHSLLLWAKIYLIGGMNIDLSYAQHKQFALLVCLFSFYYGRYAPWYYKRNEKISCMLSVQQYDSFDLNQMRLHIKILSQQRAYVFSQDKRFCLVSELWMEFDPSHKYTAYNKYNTMNTISYVAVAIGNDRVTKRNVEHTGTSHKIRIITIIFKFPQHW